MAATIACFSLDPPMPPGGVPYCQCHQCHTENQRRRSCKCGEEDAMHDWAWDERNLSSSAHLTLDNREVTFHPSYSSGTVVVRGNKPFVKGHYYFWEIKVLTPMYGTDVMVGVGTSKINIREPAIRFCSFIGSNEESWGYSYKGSIQHNGIQSQYGPPFVQGSIIGIFLDMFRGKISFYLNRHPLGVAFDSVKAEELYPMVCSTAAKSGMRLIYSFSCEPSLEVLCIETIGTSSNLMKKFDAVPYFKTCLAKFYWWLLPRWIDESKEKLCDCYTIWKKMCSSDKSSSDNKSTQQLVPTMKEDEKIAIEILDWDGTPVAELSLGPSTTPTSSTNGVKISHLKSPEDETYPGERSCKKLCVTRDDFYF